MPNKYIFILLNLISDLQEKNITCYLTVSNSRDCLGNTTSHIYSFVITDSGLASLKDEPTDKDIKEYIEQIKAILEGAV